MVKGTQERDFIPVLQSEAAVRFVLVVDDSSLQRRILSASLSRWGYRVEEAACGDEALEVCRQRLPDLVISDWMMPGMSGLEFCQAFRALSVNRYGYFILLTTKSEKAEVARGLDAGADDFLSKPVNNDELRARISAGERILLMQRELTEKNRLITETLTELQRVYNLLDNDLIEAKKLQQSLLRERYKQFEAGDLSLMLRSSGHVGGDLVGYFPINQDQIGLFAMDVSGHGISSALMTARLAGYLSATTPDQNIALTREKEGRYSARSPAAVIATLNDLVLNEMDTEHHLTSMIATVELPTGRVSIAQAGHPHPVVQRRNGQVEQSGTGGFPVGLLSDVSYETSEIQLNPGDRLLILSDGVTECPGRSGQMLGEAGLAGILAHLADTRGPAFLEAMMWELSDHCGHTDFPDDVSGILFEYHGRPAQ